MIEDKEFKSNVDPNNYNEDYSGEGDYDVKLLESIDLPEYSQYFIEVSLLLSCGQTYFYFYKDKASYQSVFPSGAITLPMNNVYVPIKFCYLFDNRSVKQKQL